MLLASGLVVYVLWLAAGRYGRIRSAPTMSSRVNTVSWVAMMFSAGIGIGLMFYGVSEPLSHFMAPPPGTAEGGTDAALQTAMATTLFHWPLHPWAIDAVVGIAIAYGTFRRGRSQLISSAFAPLLGKRTEGPIGKVIDSEAAEAAVIEGVSTHGDDFSLVVTGNGDDPPPKSWYYTPHRLSSRGPPIARPAGRPPFKAMHTRVARWRRVGEVVHSSWDRLRVQLHW